jgi:hypothetical protein
MKTILVNPYGAIKIFIKYPLSSTRLFLWKVQSEIKMTNQPSFFLDTLKVKNWKELLRCSISNVEVNGLFLEFGVYKGKMTNYIALTIPHKTIYGFDSFKGLPETWTNIARKGIFKLNKLPKTEKNVKLVVGLFQESLELFLEQHKEKVAFVNMDADLYSSTKYVLTTLARHSRLQDGTIIQFDEFSGYPGWRTGGEYKAFMEFLKEFKFKFICLGHSMGKSCSVQLIKEKSVVKYGVPCSKIVDKIKDVTIHCTSEDEAMALAVGAWFAGKKPVVYMQNSGLGRIVDIVSSLYKPYNIPLPKLILSVRRSPDHHKFMGEITEELLRLIDYDGELEVVEEDK